VIDDSRSTRISRAIGSSRHGSTLCDKSSGSTVGYLEAPFAEQTIVNGGHQSMPLDYNNVKSPVLSGKSSGSSLPCRTGPRGEGNTLVLYVRGRAGNVGRSPVHDDSR